MGKNIGIIENEYGRFKANIVLAKVWPVFVFIPLKSHSLIATTTAYGLFLRASVHLYVHYPAISAGGQQATENRTPVESPVSQSCCYPEDDQPTEQQHMTIHLTPEQERRLRAVLDRGAYKSVEEVVEAALTAVEQRTAPGFAGTPEELDTLLAEGLASKQLTEDEFWSSVSKRTDALLAEHKTGPRS